MTLHTRIAVDEGSKTTTVVLTTDTPQDVQLSTKWPSYMLQADPANTEGIWFRLNAETGGVDPVELENGAGTTGSNRLPPGAEWTIDPYPLGSVLRVVSGAAAKLFVVAVQPSNPRQSL